MKHLTPFFISLRNNFGAFALFVVVWGLGALCFPPYIVPSPLAVGRDAATYLDAAFWSHLFATLYRVTLGFLWAFIPGTLLGVLAAAFRQVSHLTTLMGLAQVVPGPILGVIFLLIFGLGHATPIALVAALTLPSIAINTAGVLAKKNRLLEQYLRSIGGGRRDLIRHVYLPLLIPTVQSNLTLGLSLALKVVVLGEFIGSQDGLGYLLNVAKMYFNMAAVFFYLSVILLLMVAFQILEQAIFTIFFGKYFYPE